MYPVVCLPKILNILKQKVQYLRSFSDVTEKIPYFIEDVHNNIISYSSLSYWSLEEYEIIFTKNFSYDLILVKACKCPV